MWIHNLHSDNFIKVLCQNMMKWVPFVNLTFVLKFLRRTLLPSREKCFLQNTSCSFIMLKHLYFISTTHYKILPALIWKFSILKWSQPTNEHTTWSQIWIQITLFIELLFMIKFANMTYGILFSCSLLTYWFDTMHQ